VIFVIFMVRFRSKFEVLFKLAIQPVIGPQLSDLQREAGDINSRSGPPKLTAGERRWTEAKGTTDVVEGFSTAEAVGVRT
jgi:hypothetical protein